MVIWICGLSGAGKSTLGGLVYDHLRALHLNVVLLDGDALREAISSDLGYDTKSRRRNSLRIANICHLLDGQGIHVVVCAVTISTQAQEANRTNLSEYHEVYINVSLDTLRRRDPKDIYARAHRKEITNVAGVDIPYSPPINPHLVIYNDIDRNDMTPLAEQVLKLALSDGTERLPTGRPVHAI